MSRHPKTQRRAARKPAAKHPRKTVKSAADSSPLQFDSGSIKVTHEKPETRTTQPQRVYRTIRYPATAWDAVKAEWLPTLTSWFLMPPAYTVVGYWEDEPSASLRTSVGAGGGSGTIQVSFTTATDTAPGTLVSLNGEPLGVALASTATPDQAKVAAKEVLQQERDVRTPRQRGWDDSRDGVYNPYCFGWLSHRRGEPRPEASE